MNICFHSNVLSELTIQHGYLYSAFGSKNIIKSDEVLKFVNQGS